MTAVALAAIAVFSGFAFRDRRARMAVAFGIAGVLLSLGPAVPGQPWLYRIVVPPRASATSRGLWAFAIVAVAVLAGFGVALIHRRWPRAPMDARRDRRVCARRQPRRAFRADQYKPRPSRYPHSPPRARRERDRGRVSVLPAGSGVPARALHAALSLDHWRPMLNGYSGLTPESFVQACAGAGAFPRRDRRSRRSAPWA